MRTWWTIATAALAVFLGACGSSSSSSSSTASSSAGTSTQATGSGGQIGFEGVPIEHGAPLGSTSTTGTGPADGIRCGPSEQLVYHIHTHLQVYVEGQARSLPGGIGIPSSTVVPSLEGPVAQGGQCIYWLHTHAPDGVIHVESPSRRIYTLGNFFDEWRQPLSGDRVASASGMVTAFVDGKPWTKSPRAIPLLPHAVIQLSLGQPVVPFHSMSWAGLQL